MCIIAQAGQGNVLYPIYRLQIYSECLQDASMFGKYVQNCVGSILLPFSI